MTWIDIFPKKTSRWTTGIWKDAQNHSSSRKCKSQLQWDIPSHLLGWLLSKRQEICWQGLGEEKSLVHSLWEYKLPEPVLENSMAVPQKIKNWTTTWSSNATPEYIAEGIELSILKGYLHVCARARARAHTHTHTHTMAQGRSNPAFRS